jgi:hypothetical protein
MLANPFRSVSALLCVTFRITGIAGFCDSPLAELSPCRNTVAKKLTVAPNTGLGGDAEFVTRTTTG